MPSANVRRTLQGQGEFFKTAEVRSIIFQSSGLLTTCQRRQKRIRSEVCRSLAFWTRIMVSDDTKCKALVKGKHLTVDAGVPYRACQVKLVHRQTHNEQKEKIETKRWCD
jgi:hypothetical protein